MGGKNQQPVAFSPKTKYFYVPANNLCMDYEGVQVKYQAGQSLTFYLDSAGGLAPDAARDRAWLVCTRWFLAAVFGYR